MTERLCNRGRGEKFKSFTESYALSTDSAKAYPLCSNSGSRKKLYKSLKKVIEIYYD